MHSESDYSQTLTTFTPKLILKSNGMEEEWEPGKRKAWPFALHETKPRPFLSTRILNWFPSSTLQNPRPLLAKPSEYTRSIPGVCGEAIYVWQTSNQVGRQKAGRQKEKEAQRRGRAGGFTSLSHFLKLKCCNLSARWVLHEYGQFLGRICHAGA